MAGLIAPTSDDGIVKFELATEKYFFREDLCLLASNTLNLRFDMARAVPANPPIRECTS